MKEVNIPRVFIYDFLQANINSILLSYGWSQVYIIMIHPVVLCTGYLLVIHC